MTYAVDGYFSAPWYFYVNSTTGAVRVRSNLLDDRLQTYTVSSAAVFTRQDLINYIYNYISFFVIMINLSCFFLFVFSWV